MQTIQSPTLALLAVPSIHAGGIESSVVFHQLPASVQDAIRSATDSGDLHSWADARAVRPGWL